MYDLMFVLPATIGLVWILTKLFIYKVTVGRHQAYFLSKYQAQVYASKFALMSKERIQTDAF